MENFDAEQPMEDLQEQTPKKEPKNPLYDCYSLLHDLVYILAAITIVFVFFVRLVGVDGPSMMPTLQDGDYVALLSNLFMGDLEQGDVIVARKESLKTASRSSSASSPRRVRPWISSMTETATHGLRRRRAAGRALYLGTDGAALL